MRELGAALLHLIFPGPCRACGQPLGAGRRSAFCRPCWEGTRFIQDPVCPCCGWPFPSPVALAASPDHLCGRCRVRGDAFALARAVALYEPGGVIREGILLFKHGRRTLVGEALAGLMALRAPSCLDIRAWDCLVPVPLYWRREWERGFNQAAILARGVGRRHRLPVHPRALRRLRPTPAQSGSPDDRTRNVRGAFRVRQRGRVAGGRVLLIDDVFTTGATANACAEALLHGGAAAVGVYTLARVP